MSESGGESAKPLPPPKPGQVIRFNFLWSHEADKGQKVGEKDRPCVTVIAAELDKATGFYRIVLAPITHTMPGIETVATKLTPRTQYRLKLDDEQCWIVANELNEVIWPSNFLAEDPGSVGYMYGELPAVVFEDVKAKILALNQAQAEKMRPAKQRAGEQKKPHLSLVKRDKY